MRAPSDRDRLELAESVLFEMYLKSTGLFQKWLGRPDGHIAGLPQPERVNEMRLEAYCRIYDSYRNQRIGEEARKSRRRPANINLVGLEKELARTPIGSMFMSLKKW